ncbi:ubiquinol-cytochrome c reductase cytochrome c subunit [Actinoplanes lutulentus]|uniref:Cytochrome bc1 complex cytochrome c subunit n=1 Tax=Actinoplanes lutulentus TaxID=1287878 RepID=A0A327ZG51_9ACTN|nr:c-type cytochrome [Actinoplanes lutulentus]MBB2941718.1 ubiquinol-cytochrome c reductase cytochrome c subunit [Actinoplanes lutulentus]RAK39638.1 menaquinol-cytochrome c reductase cytochrome c1 subunit precursor [Actinoplanes lutulentus]
MTSDTPARRRARVFSRRRSAPSRARRRLGAAVRMIAALALAGGVYTAFTPGAFAEDNVQLSAAAQEGKALFDNSCISCHGRDGQGVEERGPSLIGVGSASVEFQVSTGRMPMTRQEAQAEQKTPQFDETQTKQLAQYIQELGGGPELPEGELVEDLKTNPDALARGGELFRINCTSCHGFGGGGGALSSGKFAPSLHDATQEQIYAAMLTGPQNMPVFGDNQLTPDEKREIITYITVQLQDDRDPGGLFNLGRYGPSTEGMAIFLVGIVLLVFTSLWIAGKS